ncbi:hypothetical protein L479_02027 [Exiguobacterium sp. S17]|nr:hypothetical protein L479_02027 [Exiguobacterium sp. S17]
MDDTKLRGISVNRAIASATSANAMWDVNPNNSAAPTDSKALKASELWRWVRNMDALAKIILIKKLVFIFNLQG